MKSDLWEFVSNKLRHARLDAGLSVEELGKITGIPADTLMEYEVSSKEMKFADLQIIAEAVNVETLSFFSGFTSGK